MSDPEATAPPNTPLRRATDLPPDSPWWARWIETNIGEAWKWASVRFPAAVAVLAEVYAANPAQVNQWVEDTVPSTWWPHLVAVGCLIQVSLRVVNLKGKP